MASRLETRAVNSNIHTLKEYLSDNGKFPSDLSAASLLYGDQKLVRVPPTRQYLWRVSNQIRLYSANEASEWMDTSVNFSISFYYQEHISLNLELFSFIFFPSKILMLDCSFPLQNLFCIFSANFPHPLKTRTRKWKWLNLARQVSPPELSKLKNWLNNILLAKLGFCRSRHRLHTLPVQCTVLTPAGTLLAPCGTSDTRFSTCFPSFVTL